MNGLPEHLQTKLRAQIAADPCLPRANPTTSFWQLPPHENLSNIQSPQLPAETDYAIIGSGVTGCSIAKNLLEHPEFSKNAKVSVFEARSLCSGATGRNGGALISPIPGSFNQFVTGLGESEAIKIGRYAFRTLEKMHALGKSSPDLEEASEVRRLRCILGFTELASFEDAKSSFQKYDELVSNCRVNFEVITGIQALEQYNLKNIVGAIVFDGGAFWPYRLITGIWSDLMTTFHSQLTIDTGTPVLEVTSQPDDPTYPHHLVTPRGVVRAAHVIYATNAFTGHLLPCIRGKIFPLRGTMSTQVSTPSFGHHGRARMWTIAHSARFDQTTGMFETGLYYSNQNPKSNDIFIGGENVQIDEMLVSDDTVVQKESKTNIEGILPRFFDKGWEPEKHPEIRNVWSGIMGFSSDGLPLIGKLPSCASGKTKSSEWIAAAWNGYGMPQCWSGGEAVAKMMLGEDVGDWLPSSHLCSEERLQKMSAQASLDHLMGTF